MRILYISQYFPPEVGATQTRAYEMARGLVRAGHKVTVIGEFPNHPHGIMPADYRGRLLERVLLDGIDVIRVWVYTSTRKNFASRMAFYLSFMVMAIWAALFVARDKYDVIYASSPPLFVGAAALVIRFLRRIPLVFEVRDLWPESAIQLGELSNPHAIAWATRLEEACYHQARHIVAVTQGIYDSLQQRNIADDKLTLIPNGANTELYMRRTPRPELAARLGVGPGHFVAMYTGLHGLAHGLETVLCAADLLRDHEDILFLFVGDGPQRAALMALAKELELPNTVFHHAVPEVELPDYLALAHIGLDCRRRIGISEGTLPVKMFSYMACEVPVLLSIEGEAAALLQRARAGIAVPPETPRALADAILDLQRDPGRCAFYGQQGRAFVEKNFSRQGFVHVLETLLTEVHRRNTS